MEGNIGYAVLYEARAFRQARERTYLKWKFNMYPCRMKMKEAGWFIVRTKNEELVAVCLYCEKGCKGWTCQHDPYEVHRVLSPNCPFILNAHATQTPSSPIVESMSRREQVRPSLHMMAKLPERIKSFEQWPLVSPHPSFDVLADAGLFYTDQHATVECFSCSGQIHISHINDDPMLAHINQCKYARHLRGYSQSPLDIQASGKVYQLVKEQTTNAIFYFLQCTSGSTPGILLSAISSWPDEQELKDSDKNLKELRPNDHLQKKVNWVTSSDGPLVNILQDLANNPTDLTTLSEDRQYSTETSSLLPLDTTDDSAFQCKTCLCCDATPHIVSIKCSHLGLCSQECFPKWLTCVICGYALRKAIRIFGG